MCGIAALIAAASLDTPDRSQAHVTQCTVRADRPHQSAHQPKFVVAHAYTICKHQGDTPLSINATFFRIGKSGLPRPVSSASGVLVKPQTMRATVKFPCDGARHFFQIDSIHRIRSHTSPKHPPPGFTINTQRQANAAYVTC